MNKVIATTALAAALAACASIVDEKTQVVSVETPWCHAARCELANEGGRYYAKSTPASLVINKSEEDLVMTCEREGQSAVTVFESSANGYMTAGNILLFGGILGIIVDDSSGAGYDYETRLLSELDCGDEPGPEVLAHLREREALAERARREEQRKEQAEQRLGVN